MFRVFYCLIWKCFLVGIVALSGLHNNVGLASFGSQDKAVVVVIFPQVQGNNEFPDIQDEKATQQQQQQQHQQWQAGDDTTKLTFTLVNMTANAKGHRADDSHDSTRSVALLSFRRKDGLTFQFELESNAHLHSSIPGCVAWKGRDRENQHDSRRFNAVALTLCDRNALHGIIFIGNEQTILEIKPIDNGGIGNAHSIVTMKSRLKREVGAHQGFLLDDIWKFDKNKPSLAWGEKASNMTKRGEIRCQGSYCQYFKVKQDEPKWLELAIIVDSSVVQFHGNETVRRYVLTLLNVVSAIYSDPTLGSNLRFVLSRIISVPESDDPIISGKSKESLANVNKWNEAHLRQLPEDQKHDLAIWITRKDIGGPSGYAPVSGICDPARSCSLIHEDGLSSSFIIAHELGHLLGLSHDGDSSAGNECQDEALQGSVMAPMVGATFSYFHWSSCSAEEYHFMSDDWHCLQNPPRFPNNVTFVSNSFHHAYTLDEQCRMEFGEGFRFCNSFQLPDPCAQLWCSHETTPDTCKTKKGPPMDGTECDVGKWCINGYCESTSKRRRNDDGLRHNPQAGGWSHWGSWEDCSRTCGAGVAFRVRKCDNPRPTYGGEPCRGDNEEFKLCNLDPCPKLGDFRAQQCQDLFELISMNSGQQSSRSKMTWYPYEHDLEDYKCKLTCHNRESKEYYQTGENVIDGTPCSYDHPSDICIQGKCVKLGCDMILGSPLIEDQCGICGGNGDRCQVKNKELQGSFKSDRTKIAYLPRGTRNIRLLVRSKGTFLAFKEQKENNWITFDQHLQPQSSSNNSLLATPQTKVNQPFRQSFVSSGAKFEVSPGAESFFARGPLISPLTIFVSSAGQGDKSNEVGNYMVDLQYNESPQKEPTKTRPELVVQGWSKCSKECGGGRQTVILRCVDQSSGRRLRKKLCRSNASSSNKKLRRTRTCNNFSCDFTWSSGPWEECTHSCGVQGVQFRQSFCVPVEMTHSWGTPLWQAMVDPTNCRGEKPQRSRECNRVPCIGDWIQSDWTSCSTSCGVGIQKATFECQSPRPHDLFYDCGPRPVVHKQCQLASTCPKEPCQSRLEVDQSKICADQVMQRYCAIPSYRQMCCQSCRKHTDWQYL